VAEPIPVRIPRESVNDEAVRILCWKFPSGSLVSKEELLCEVETSKVVMEVHAPDAGYLQYDAAAGEELAIGAVICYIVPPEQTTTESAAEPAVPENSPEPLPPRLSAAARKLAAQYGVDASAFAPGMLVRSADVLRHAGKQPAGSQTNDPVERVATRSVPARWSDLPRRKIVESGILRRGQAASIQSSVSCTCKAKQLYTRIEKLGIAAGLQTVVIFEAARLLKKYPEFNAACERGRIGQYEHINVGWALDGGHGLVVPVIENADEKSITEIGAIMQRQIEAYLAERLSPGEIAGGTFTISDLSGYSASFFQPLISEGQSAILGIGSGLSPGDGTISLTLAFDHQLSEGKRAAQFLQDLSMRLEEHGALASSKPDTEPYCIVCQRDRRTLQQHRLILLRSEVPSGFICSLCIAGW